MIIIIKIKFFMLTTIEKGKRRKYAGIIEGNSVETMGTYNDGIS